MKKTMLCVCAMLALAVPCFAMGQSWDGTWKLNEAKSNITGQTFTIEDKGNGMMHVSGGEMIPYDFACDGKSYPMTGNQTRTCTGSASAGYESVTRAGDKVVYKSRRTFSADGKTMTVHGTETRPDGTTQEYTEVWKRESGTTGLVGKWRMAKADEGTSVMVLERKGDWIRAEYPQYKSKVEGKMDGSYLVATGPTVPAGSSTAFNAEGPNIVHYRDKYKDTVTDEGTMTLSADGRTLVDEEWPTGKMSEKTTLVYERQ
jgi:hypothetical protein